MSADLADFATSTVAPTRRFSSTQATFQFATLTFIVVVLTFVAGAAAFGAAKPGSERMLLLASCVSLIIPAGLAARIIIETTNRNSADRGAWLAGQIKSVVAAIGVSMLLFLASAVMRDSTAPKTLLDAQRENVRFLFGLNDLADVRLVNYAKVNGKVEAELATADRVISVVIAPAAVPVAAAPTE